MRNIEFEKGKEITEDMQGGTQIKVKIDEVVCVLKDTKKENFKYKVLNPGGNKTALVIGNEYTKIERKSINEKILKENLDIEQVGFISKKENKLEMVGEELCVNAARCAVWEYLNGNPGEISLKVSGYNENLEGGITNEKDVYVKMKINKLKDSILEQKGIFNFVKLDGILLAVIDEENSKKYVEELKKDEKKTKFELKGIMEKFKTHEKAVGIILLEKQNEKIKINPIIWVKQIDTLYYETACGSGSLATAIFKNCNKGLEEFDIIQPSGYSIKIKLNIQKECIESATITGKVF